MANKTFTDVKINVTFSKATSDVTVQGGNSHASNISGTPTPQDLALALGKIQNWYDNWDSVVWTGAASTVNGHTVNADVPADAKFTDTTYTAGTGLTLNGTTIDHTDTVTAITTPGFYKLKYNATGHITGTTAVTKSDITGLGIPASDTTYTFAEGSTDGAFTVTPSGGSAQTVNIHGLGSMAYESSSSFISSKPDGTTDFFNNDTIINSKYLPSYVDDVIEGYYYNGKFYEDSGHTTEITGENGKIYVDLSVTPAEPYRWSGTAFVSMKSPTISAVADVVYKSNGVITKSFTDGSASADVTVYTHPTTAGNKHIPTGGSAGQILVYGGTSGTAVWGNPAGVPDLEPAPDSSTAGEAGIAPAPGPETYAAGTAASPYRHYLRADATWSDDPVTEYDTLTLNVVAAS